MKRLLTLVAIASTSLPGAAQANVIERIVAIGQRAEVDQGVTVTPLRVIEDSRCPVQTMCVWAGRVVIAARVRDHGRVRQVRLTLGEPLTVGKGRLTLDQVLPVKRVGNIAPRTYRFGFSYARSLPESKVAAPL